MRTALLAAGRISLLAAIALSGVDLAWGRRAEVPPARQFVITRSRSPIQVDGVLNDAGWQGALTFDLPYEWSPGDNSTPPVRTDFLVTYDDHALYAAWRCQDPDPSKIRAHLMDRDALETFTHDDHVLLMIDPFGDARRAFQFRVNALGVQVDATYDETDGTSDFLYDMIWTSAARTGTDGWIVEIAIPLDQIRFPRRGRSQTWRLDVERSYPRDVRHRISAWPRDRDNSCLLCQVNQVVGFEHVTPGVNLELDPTVTASRLDDELDPDGDLRAGETDVEPGLSLRWGVTSNLTFAGTLNPDFSQVEADAAQLTANRRFALYYPEKRPFFLEDSDIFSTPIQAVYTRTIADPDWGIKLAGKGGRQTLGLFVAKDTINNLLLPSNQESDSTSIEEEVTTAVLRYRVDIGRGSSIGLLYTDREGDPYSNRVAGLDGHFRLGSSDELRAQYLGSTSRYPDEVAGCSDPATRECDDEAWSLAYDHSSRNWRAYLFHSDLGIDFRADAGFVPRVDTITTEAGLSRIFREGTAFTRVELGGAYRRIDDHSGQLTDEKLELSSLFEGARESTTSFALKRYKEFFDGVLYDDLDRAQLTFSIHPGASVAFGFFADVGTVVDYDEGRKTHQREFSPALRLLLGRHLQLDMEHDRRTLDKPSGPPLVEALSQARAVLSFTTRTFVRAIVQYEDEEQDGPADRSLFYQLLFSHKVNPRTVLFLGYSETRETDADVGDGLLPTEREAFVKLGYAWTL